MKLRNKKTGEIKSIEEIIRDAFLSNELDSLKSIGTNWEDVDVTNATNIPLIKDEKIRKAVRAWAEINDLYSVEYKEDSNGAGFDCIKSTDELVRISFASLILPLKKNRVYTIAELCGEEEE